MIAPFLAGVAIGLLLTIVSIVLGLLIALAIPPSPKSKDRRP